MTSANDRQRAAELARALYAGTMNFEEFLLAYPESNDPDVEELLDLIEHEPKRGGFLGVSEAKHQEYMSRIQSLITKLHG